MASASANSVAESLAHAAHHVHEQLEANSRYWDLSDLLHIIKDCGFFSSDSFEGDPAPKSAIFSHFVLSLSAQTNLSGLHNDDYPALSKSVFDQASMPSVAPVERVPLPQELVDQFNRILLNS